MDSGVYDIEALAKDLQLEYEDITDLYISYIDQVDEHCKTLKEIFNKKDFMELKRQVHNLKGVAANLLLKDVFNQADLCERLLENGDSLNLKQHLEGLSNLLINSKDKVIKSFAKVNVII